MPTYYIDPAGNDSTGDGSSGTPWQTISKAHTEASSGDTIICKTSTSTYTWTDQTFSKNLTIQGEQTPNFNSLTGLWEGAIFDGGGAQVRWTGSVTLSVKKLVFQDADNYFVFIGRAFFENMDLTLNGCIFQNLALQHPSEGYNGGIANTDTDKTVTVSGCIFTNLTASAPRGLFTSLAASGTLILSGNSFYNPPSSIVWQRDNGPITATVKNNIFVNTGGSIAWYTEFSGGSINFTFDNNCTNGSWSSVPSGSNNITSDPQFVDPTNGNFNLRQDSPLFGAGVTI